MLAIGASYRISENAPIEHRRFDNWADYFDWLVNQAEMHERFRTVFSHNGGGWDWHGLALWLSAHRSSFEVMHISRAQSKIITMTVKVRSSDDQSDRFNIVFADSLYLLRSSLHKLGDVFFKEGKTEADIESVWTAWRKNKKRFYAYLCQDCGLLLRVLEKALDIIREHIAKIDSLGITIGGTAMKVFRTGFLDRDLKVPTDSDLKKFLRLGYRGGRVEVFRVGEFSPVNVYDVNSLYPAAMIASPVPVSDRMILKFAYEKKEMGVWKIHYHQFNRNRLPVMMDNKGHGSYRGTGIFFSPEIELLKSVDPSAEIHTEYGYVFPDVDFIFKEYVTSLYNLRLSNPGGPISELCKYLLNSLYGKFGQRGERERLVIFADNADYLKAKEDGRNVEMIAPDSPFFAEVFYQPAQFEHVGIAGVITSQARVMLYRYLNLLPKEKIIYCDTDSIHTTGTLPSECVSPTELGKVKKEFTGDGIYCGKKLYALRDSSGVKLRAKGVTLFDPSKPDKTKHGAKLNYEDYRKMLNGEKIRCEFSQPNTIIQALRGKPINVIGNPDGSHNRCRTIRVTV